MKTHYQLLAVEPTASADDIKRAFRREIARYHPDKVQHLGAEFQEIASTRAAELTEAYRVLMDVEARRKYDEAIADGLIDEAPRQPPPPRDAPRSEPAAPPRPRPPAADPEPSAKPDHRFHQERATTTDFVRKAALAKLRDAVNASAGSASSLPASGFDAGFVIKPKKVLFKKADASVQLLARVVPQVDAAAVEQTWPLAAKLGAFDGLVCVLVMGSGLASTRELGAAVAEHRRKARGAAPIIVPVDIRDWEALFPPEAPEIVRQIVQRLRTP